MRFCAALSFVLAGRQAKTTYDEQVKTATLRRIYHEATANPMHRIEEVWSAYNAFEQGLNKQLVRGSIHLRARPPTMDSRSLPNLVRSDLQPTRLPS